MTTSTVAGPADVRRRAITIPSGDGVELAATWHEVEPDARGVAVVAPGVAVPARIVHPLADHLARAGWQVLSFDFPGVGASRTMHPRDVPGGIAEWGSRDLDAALRLANEEASGRPVVLVGHSAGAWLIGLTGQAASVDAVAAIASMSGYWRNLKRKARWQLVGAFFVAIPLTARALGYIPGQLGLGEDAPGQALAQWARWCRTAGFYLDDPAVGNHVGALEAPVRVWLPEDDEWATEEAVRGMWDHFPRTSYDVEVVRPADHGGNRIGHLGLLRDRFAPTVWADLTDWLDRVTSDVRTG